MTVIPLRQSHSFRPVVRPILVDLLHFLRNARRVPFTLAHFLGQWIDDLGVWDAHLGAGGVPAGPTAFSQHVFEPAVRFGRGPVVDRLYPASHSTYVFGPW